MKPLLNILRCGYLSRRIAGELQNVPATPDFHNNLHNWAISLYRLPVVWTILRLY